MREKHIVPLSRQAVEVLRELQPLTGTGRYVFPGERSYARPMSENTVLGALRRLGYEKGEMTGHGFRSMASTILHELGWASEVVERQLAHGDRTCSVIRPPFAILFRIQYNHPTQSYGVPTRTFKLLTTAQGVHISSGALGSTQQHEGHISSVFSPSLVVIGTRTLPS